MQLISYQYKIGHAVRSTVWLMWPIRLIYLYSKNMNLPENTFDDFFVFSVLLSPTFSVKLLLVKINLLLIFTLTDF